MTDCLFNSCCPSVCPCETDLVKVTACVSKTEIVVEDELSVSCTGEQDAILYCWRICLDNAGQTITNARLSLALTWKILAAAPTLTSEGRSIFQNCLLTGDLLSRTEVSTNIPSVHVVGANVWNGFDQIELFDLDFVNQIPSGKWVVEVCAEIQLSQLQALGIISNPALFPSLITLRGRSLTNYCPINQSTFAGCVPESITVAPFPCDATTLPNLTCILPNNAP